MLVHEVIFNTRIKKENEEHQSKIYRDKQSDNSKD